MLIVGITPPRRSLSLLYLKVIGGSTIGIVCPEYSAKRFRHLSLLRLLRLRSVQVKRLRLSLRYSAPPRETSLSSLSNRFSQPEVGAFRRAAEDAERTNPIKPLTGRWFTPKDFRLVCLSLRYSASPRETACYRFTTSLKDFSKHLTCHASEPAATAFLPR